MTPVRTPGRSRCPHSNTLSLVNSRLGASPRSNAKEIDDGFTLDPKGKTVRPAGAWNDGRIVVHEGRLQHYLNGKKVVDTPCAGPEWTAMIQQSKFKNWPFGTAKEGRMALQDHGDEVAYRNLRIKKF